MKTHVLILTLLLYCATSQGNQDHFLHETIDCKNFKSEQLEDYLITQINDLRKSKRREVLNSSVDFNQIAEKAFDTPFLFLRNYTAKRDEFRKKASRLIYDSHLKIRYLYTAVTKCEILPAKHYSDKRVYNEKKPKGPYFLKQKVSNKSISDTLVTLVPITPLSYQQVANALLKKLLKNGNRRSIMAKNMSYIAIKTQLNTTKDLNKKSPEVQVLVLIGGRLSSIYENKKSH